MTADQAPDNTIENGSSPAEPEKSTVKKRLPKKLYEKDLKRFHIELVKWQYWVKETGKKVIVIFEGRDAAGKGGVIRRIMEPLNPRGATVVALPKPTEREQGQWYFQRYVPYLPAPGEIVIFDRSWYNRPGVERVMGFATDDQVQEFFRSCPEFERMLVRSGIRLIKYWFSVSDEEQERRIRKRVDDPLRRWKLSPIDVESRMKWVEYSKAKDDMMRYTDLPQAPWFTVEADDKRRARLNCIRHLLSQFKYEDSIPKPVQLDPRPPLTSDYQRPPRSNFRYVPDNYASLKE